MPIMKRLAFSLTYRYFRNISFSCDDISLFVKNCRALRRPAGLMKVRNIVSVEKMRNQIASWKRQSILISLRRYLLRWKRNRKNIRMNMEATMVPSTAM